MEDSRKLSRASVDEDRISSLPVPLICHILSFLRTKTVVATSILFKKWRFMWTEVTTLNFLLRGEEPDLWDPEEEVRKFVEFVNRVSLHIKPQALQKFKLKWWGPPETSYVLIWTSFAISRCVRELVIEADLPEGTQLPGTLFTCATLQLLKLRVDIVLKLPTAVCLPELEALELHFLRYNKLISCCPALRHLVIGRTSSKMLDYRVSSPSLRYLAIFNSEERRAVDGGELVVMLYDSKIEIDAPNLEHFVMSEAVRECSVKGITSVDRAEIDLNVFLDADSDDDGIINGLYAGRCNSALKLVEAMNRAKFLDLTITVVKALSYATTPFSACFEILIELKVSIPCCQWSSLGVILGRCTKLRYLNMTKVGCCKKVHRLCWDDPKKVAKCLSSSLRKVSFVDFQGLEDEVEMIRYILQHGEVLELFTLEPATDFYRFNQNFKLLQQISAFPRISRACRFSLLLKK